MRSNTFFKPWTVLLCTKMCGVPLYFQLRADLSQKAVKSGTNRGLQILLMRPRKRVSEAPDSEGKFDRMGLERCI
jgi:hypothetical protein